MACTQSARRTRSRTPLTFGRAVENISPDDARSLTDLKRGLKLVFSGGASQDLDP